MKYNFFILLFCICTISAFAQRVAPDHIKTANGDLIIQPIYHAAIVFTWNGKTIYVDPYGGANAYKGIAAPDLVLITDIHPDHLDPETLKAIQTSKAIFVVPQAVADKMPADIKAKMVILENDKSTTQQGISIKAIPMYNVPSDDKAKHKKGRGNGYVLNIGGKMVYISGDTEDIPEMRSLQKIDIAFVCMNLPYTMSVDQASSAVLDFKPKIVYPYHYRGMDGLSDIAHFKETVNSANASIDVRLKNWYPKY